MPAWQTIDFGNAEESKKSPREMNEQVSIQIKKKERKTKQ
jgi:hypothetical protein